MEFHFIFFFLHEFFTFMKHSFAYVHSFDFAMELKPDKDTTI
jgi:hypothetical protein